MIETLGIVDVRHERASNRCKIGRKLGGKSLLEWVVRRVTECQGLDGVAVLVGGHKTHAEVAALVPPDVPVFVSDEDPLKRIVTVARRHDAQAVVRICPDNPFIDPVLIDRLITAARAEQCDYAGYCSSDGRPAILSPLGVFAEWCSATALAQADRAATVKADRIAVTRFIYSQPALFSVHLIPVPAELDRADLRLKVDLEEDWEHTQVIYEALGPSDGWDWQRLAGLLDQQPAMRKRMAALNRDGASDAAHGS